METASQVFEGGNTSTDPAPNAPDTKISDVALQRVLADRNGTSEAFYFMRDVRTALRENPRDESARRALKVLALAPFSDPSFVRMNAVSAAKEVFAATNDLDFVEELTFLANQRYGKYLDQPYPPAAAALLWDMYNTHNFDIKFNNEDTSMVLYRHCMDVVVPKMKSSLHGPPPAPRPVR